MPLWEDPANTKGGEFQIRLNMQDQSNSLETLNKLWLKNVVDVVTGQIPHSD
jgi:hypothetical protein